MDIFIYVIKDPTTGQVVYVGQTNDPRRRALEHEKPHLQKQNRKFRLWKQSVRRAGLAPVFEVIACASELDVDELETYWIRHYKARGRTFNACDNTPKSVARWLPNARPRRVSALARNGGHVPKTERAKREKMAVVDAFFSAK